VANEGVLLRALKAAGYRNISGTLATGIRAATASGAYFTIANGQVEMSGAYLTGREVEQVAASVKRAYAAEAVQTAAKKNGWSTTTNKKTGQLTLTRKRW
jgi:hypothetical protein